MVMIIDVICTKCGKRQKMELRKFKLNELGNPILKNKRKVCVRCEKSFKVDMNSVLSTG